MIETALIIAGEPAETAEMLHALDALRARAHMMAVAAADPQTRADIAKRFDIPAESQFPDANELLEKTRTDMVVVCAPPALRAGIILACAKAGVHIAAPAPVAQSDEDARHIRDCLTRNIVRMTALARGEKHPVRAADRPSALISDLAAFIEYLETGVGDYPGKE